MQVGKILIPVRRQPHGTDLRLRFKDFLVSSDDEGTKTTAKSSNTKKPAERVIKDIRRATRRHFSAEDKIRVVLEGLRGEGSIAELCRKEGIAQSLYYTWSKEFMEAGKNRLAGDTSRQASSDDVKGLRQETAALNEVVADLMLENRLLKKSMIADGATKNEVSRIRKARDYQTGRAVALAGKAHPRPVGHRASNLLPLV
jgi:transposase